MDYPSLLFPVFRGTSRKWWRWRWRWGGSSVTSASGAAREQDGGKRTKKKKAVPEQQMEPRAGKEEVEEKDGGGWWVFGGRILAGRQRVSEPGSAIKSRGSRSSSAPHLSGRHAITGFVYTGLCTAGNLGGKWRMSCSRWCDEQLPLL